MPSLAINLNDGNEYVFDIIEERLSIGRDSRNDIVINNTFISGFHAELIRQADGGYELLDLKSSNNTFVNGTQVERARVKDGDKIRFGQLDSRFREAPSRDNIIPLKATPALVKKDTRPITPVIISLIPPNMENAAAKVSAIAKGKTPGSSGEKSSLPKQTVGVPIDQPAPESLELAKLQEDIALAKKNLDSLQAEAGKTKEEHLRSLKDKEVALAELAALRQQITETAKQSGSAMPMQEDRSSAPALQPYGDAGLNDHCQNIHESLKAAEGQRAELASAISQMSRERDDLTRDLLAKAEKGRAQHTLTHTLTTRREKLEAELLSLQEQKEQLVSELAKAREILEKTQTDTQEHQQQAQAAQATAGELLTKAEEAIQQHASLQKEMALLEGEMETSRLELNRVTEAVTIRTQEAELAGAAGEILNGQVAEKQATAAQLERQLESLAAKLAERHQEISAVESDKGLLDRQLSACHQEIILAEAQLAEVNAQTERQEKRLLELRQAEKQLVEVQAALSLASLDQQKARAECQRLLAEQAELEKRVPSLRAEADNLQVGLAVKGKKLAQTEERVERLTIQAASLEAQTRELAQVMESLDVNRRALVHSQEEKTKLTATLAPLAAERLDHENALPGLRSEIHRLREELQVLQRDRQAMSAELEKTQGDRKAVQEEATRLKAEMAGLEQRLQDTLRQLDAETTAKQAEAAAAETHLLELQKQIATSEERTSALAATELKLMTASAALIEAEKERQSEEIALAGIRRQQENLNNDISKYETEFKALQSQIMELGKKARTEETRASDAAARLQKAAAAAQATDVKRLESEAALAKTREEEKLLRKQIPALTSELSALQTKLVSLTKEREEASQFVTRLNVTTENANKKLAEVQQQISQLEAAHQVREERLMKAQEELDKEAARLKTAQEATRTAEQALQILEREVRESRLRSDAARTLATSLETELHTRMDRVENLKMEEARLLKEGESQKLEVQNCKASLEARQNEAGKSLRHAAERELAMQVKINALQEALNRESSRVELAKKERTAMEAELGTFTQQAEKQATSMQAQEDQMSQRLADLDTQVKEYAATAERLKAEISALHDRRAEVVQAEAQMNHWQEIEARLRGQLLELEEKHEILRRGLVTEESTVVMFAHDIIKRIDLIDALSSRYAGHNGGDVVAQIRTLRHSFEDILLQHGISEFDVASGTEVDLELRQRITVVESIPGKNKPRVVETCRSGFIYSREDGHELILRKVEVKTSSH
jgi:chromosome segregation ATPase/pSer/pThr/pTyr-binding forkhead associated (FHA) protein